MSLKRVNLPNLPNLNQVKSKLLIRKKKQLLRKPLKKSLMRMILHQLKLRRARMPEKLQWVTKNPFPKIKEKRWLRHLSNQSEKNQCKRPRKNLFKKILLNNHNQNNNLKNQLKALKLKLEEKRFLQNRFVNNLKKIQIHNNLKNNLEKLFHQPNLLKRRSKLRNLISQIVIRLFNNLKRKQPVPRCKLKKVLKFNQSLALKFNPKLLKSQCKNNLMKMMMNHQNHQKKLSRNLLSW